MTSIFCLTIIQKTAFDWLGEICNAQVREYLGARRDQDSGIPGLRSLLFD